MPSASYAVVMATPMTDEQRRAFLLDGTRTGILATVRADGRPHAAPIWFTLDGDDAVFTTNAQTVKGRNLRRTGRAMLVVDESMPPFDFVTLEGPVEISEDAADLLHWATVLGGRYMGAEQAEQFGKRNAVPGELLVRLRPDKIVALSGIAE
jgi:PPOX class probable F420-dependent enzyme